MRRVGGLTTERRAWREGGADALRSAVPASVPKLPAAQFVELEAELGKGPAVHGFEDQRWTRVRVRVEPLLVTVGADAVPVGGYALRGVQVEVVEADCDDLAGGQGGVERSGEVFPGQRFGVGAGLNGFGEVVVVVERPRNFG